MGQGHTATNQIQALKLRMYFALHVMCVVFRRMCEAAQRDEAGGGGILGYPKIKHLLDVVAHHSDMNEYSSLDQRGVSVHSASYKSLSLHI